MFRDSYLSFKHLIDRGGCHAWGRVCWLYLESIVPLLIWILSSVHFWIITSCPYFIIWELLLAITRWFVTSWARGTCIFIMHTFIHIFYYILTGFICFYTPVIWRPYYGMALSVRPSSVRSVVHNPCGQDIARTIWPRMLKLSVYTLYGQSKKPIYFQSQRSNRINIYMHALKIYKFLMRSKINVQ